MAKRGPKPKERIEIYGGNSEGMCDSSVYGRNENNTFTFTDIRTLVDFGRYREIESCVDFTDANITAVERYEKYLTAKKFDVDCNYSTRNKYKFKPMMDLYQVLWEIDKYTILNSAETLISLNQAIYRFDSNLCKKGRIDLEKIKNIPDKKELNQFIYDIAIIGNFMPVVTSEQKVLRYLNERFDVLLEAIKNYYLEGKKHKYFEENIYKWLDLYKDWKNFVDKNYLKGSFVDENYDVIKFDGTLSQLSQMIYNRSVVMIQEYELRVGMISIE